MKEQFVVDLREGARVDSVFALRAREVRSTRSGEAFLALTLGDRSGAIAGVVFHPRPEASACRVGAAVRVRGSVTSYRDASRISVQEMTAAPVADRRDLLPSTRRDPEELLGCLEFLMREVRHAGLRRLLDAVLGDAGFLERFTECPASIGRHHACLGGLLEHTVDVATLAQQVGQQYPYVDADLLLTGALLHDAGKVDELDWESAFAYTDEGRMLGHVVLGERRVAEAVRAARCVPSALALRLSHMLLSHHGELEWGSPRRPATLEAIILHHVDNLDAKMAGFMQAVAKSGGSEGRWTDAANLFRRPLYSPRAAADDRARRRDEDDEYCMEAV